MIKNQIKLITVLSISFFGVLSTSNQNAIGSELSFNNLSQNCRNGINKNLPTIFEVRQKQPELNREHDGELSLSWSDIGGTFFDSNELELEAAFKIGIACPEISMVVYNGATGGVSRWYIRSTNFSQRHYRHSGLPGDYDKYWNWFEIPTNYNPEYNYNPASD